jgi:hypothetical protein
MGSAHAFVIMQIGNPDLDAVYDRVMVPALRACGLDALRVDRHNAGGLLHSEIIGFIEEAQIIVADLTHERPNCYLEVGYILGCGRFTSLILTAREDHRTDSASYRPGGPKVHFDLSGYDILFWAPGRLDAFRCELQKRVERRLRMLGE